MKTLISALLLFVCIAICPSPIDARPGGGHSSSGHASFGSGSSSHRSSWRPSSFSSSHSIGAGQSHGSSLTRKETSIFLVIAIIVLIILYMMNKMDHPKSTISAPMPVNRASRQQKIRDAMALLKQCDPNFSSILFLDFVHSLYGKFYGTANQPEYAYLSPFLGKAIQPPFQHTPQLFVNEVVINAIQWQEVLSQAGDTESICLVIDANYTANVQGQRARHAITERWRLCRQKGTLSAQPDKMHGVCCPTCGAPAHFTDSGQCDHCGTLIRQGAMQWYLANRAVLKMSELDAGNLVSYTQEQGTHLPTIQQYDLAEQMASFQQLHSFAAWEEFWHGFVKDVVEAYFLSIYAHWSNRDWRGVRHLLSDRLYETNSFWLDFYREQNYFNRLENIQIARVQLAKIEIDHFYEAITVRIFAACFDYTEDQDHKIIGGSKGKLRKFSEYWTFMRRIGMSPHAEIHSLTQCPQCGAPADKMGQTGECGYCGSKISTGEFSWVLFLIMQDDAYDG